jgi:hypothetical protein
MVRGNATYTYDEDDNLYYITFDLKRLESRTKEKINARHNLLS